jgi:hypothetical protein
VCSITVRYSLEKHVYVYATYVKYGSVGTCWRIFRNTACDERIPSRQTIHNLVNTFRSTGLPMEKKQKHKRQILTEEKLHDMEQDM